MSGTAEQQGAACAKPQHPGILRGSRRGRRDCPVSCPAWKPGRWLGAVAMAAAASADPSVRCVQRAGYSYMLTGLVFFPFRGHSPFMAIHRRSAGMQAAILMAGRCTQVTA